MAGGEIAAGLPTTLSLQQPPSVAKFESPQPIQANPRELELSPEQKELIASLPVERSLGVRDCLKYNGFWYESGHLGGVLRCQDNFQALETDIMLVTSPKSGATWLKALAFAALKRNQFPEQNSHPLLFTNPHELVPFLEFSFINSYSPDFEVFGHPRLLASHLPFDALPTSVIDKGCKIVYLCRNPKDTFVSLWHFINKIQPAGRKPFSIDEAIALFTKGIYSFGSYWDNALSYMKERKENPKRIMFLMYEETMQDPKQQVKKLAEFFGCPFSPEEEAGGVVDVIVRLCSFDHLSNLEVNKNGKLKAGISNNSFFRRGEVGDSAKFLTSENEALLDQITREKFGGCNLNV